MNRLLPILLVVAVCLHAPPARADDPAPLRVISDPNPGLSGIWVDDVNDELVVSDDAHHSVIVYPRTAAGVQAPVRQIQGNSTLIDFPASVVVDTTHGEIWSTMNDTAERAVVDSRTANGDVPPLRVLDFKALVSGGYSGNRSWGLALDEANDEVAFMFQRNPGAIAVFDRSTGELKREIRGASVGLADPHGLAIDPVHDEIVGTNQGLLRGVAPTAPSITVYDRSASGDVAPLRRIQGSHTGLSLPAQIHLDESNDEMAVANGGNNSITVYARGADGDAAPLRMIVGPSTGLDKPTGVFIDSAHDEIFVANWGNHSVMVYPRTADGNVVPLRILTSNPGGPHLGLGNPGSVFFDPVNDEVVVTNCVSHPRIAVFNRLDDGQVAPKRVIEGPHTQIGRTAHGVYDDPTNNEITYVNEPGDALLVFDRAAAGDVAPIRVIQGPHTQLHGLDGGVSVDVANDEIATVTRSGRPRPNAIVVFDRLANGDVAPLRTFTSPDIRGEPVGVWVDAAHDETYVAAGTQILTFDRLAEGDVSAKRVITLVRGIGASGFQQLAVDNTNDEIVVALHGERSTDPPRLGAVLVYDRLAEGAVPPKRYIQDAGASGVQFPRSVWVDPVHDEIGEADSKRNDIRIFPRVW